MKIKKKTYPDCGAEVTIWEIPEKEITNWLLDVLGRVQISVGDADGPITHITISKIEPQ